MSNLPKGDMNNVGYVSLNYVASNTMSRIDADNRNKEKILQLIIDGYGELTFSDSIKNIKTSVIEVDDKNVVNFPADYVEYLAVSVRVGGRTYPLVLNNNILRPTEMECGEWIRDFITTETNEVFDTDNVVSYHDYPKLSSYTSGGAFGGAYYRIDHANRQIIFLTRRLTGLEVVLDYKGLDISENTMIPRQAVAALRAYVINVLDSRNRNLHNYEKDRSLKHWIAEKNKLHSMANAFTAEEYLDIRYRNTHRGLK